MENNKKLKQKEKFEHSWKRLLTITNSEKPENPVKISESEVIKIFEELVNENNEKAREDFKVKIQAILEAKRALDNSIRKGRQELAQKEEKEYESLNNEMEKAFRMLEKTKKNGEDIMKEASGDFTPKAGSEEESEDEGTQF